MYSTSIIIIIIIIIIILSLLLLLYYFINIGLQVSPTYKSQCRRFSPINRYVPCNKILIFLQFCIMWKLGQCGKYIWSLAIPL
jgi:hypothetical protein